MIPTLDPSRFVFINSDSVMNSARETEFIPPGDWVGFVLEVVGTTDAGETLLLTDVGDIELVMKGDPIQDASYDFFHGRTDLAFGRPNFPSGLAATAEELSAIIPVDENGFANSIKVRGERDAWLNLKFDALLDTRFGGAGVAGTYHLWGIPAEDTFQSYLLNIKQRNIQATGANRLSKTLPGRNITSIYIKDESPSVIEDVSVKVDGIQLVDKVPPRTLLTGTNMANNIESAGNDWLKIQLSKGGENASRRQTFNKNVELDLKFSGAGTAQVYFAYMNWFSEEKARANAIEIASKASRKGDGAAA